MASKKDKKFWAKPVHDSGQRWSNGEGSRWIAAWPNWYINRGRMGESPTASEFRRASWRRVL